MKEKFYLTTPIYYPSSNFHIGHCYTTVIADAIARYKREKGYDVFFLTGTDEHGQKIQKKAEAAGVTPKEYVDKIVTDTKDLWNVLGITYDRFIRTTDEDHIQTVQKIFKKLYDQGDIYKGAYKGKYCTPCEAFWTETQLVDGKCPDCGREVNEVSEEAYFFRLSKYQHQLEEYLESHPDFIEPVSRKNEMINNFIKPGLEDLCVSRTSFNWGIPVTFDEKHVIYVWIDALSNYISALGYLSADDSKFKKYWPADLHIVGKEIVRFHTIIWPIMLMALGLPLPHKVFGHGWLVIDGGKISKSLGNYRDPREYINEYGVDAIRYFILREVPFGSDGNFSEEALINRTNGDLANVLGNLVNRTIGMCNKYFDSIVPERHEYNELDEKLISYVMELPKIVEKNIDTLDIPAALESIIELFRKCNKYIDETTPWILAKENKERLETVIYVLLSAIKHGAVAIKPFLPTTSSRIFEQLNITDEDITSFETLKAGTKLNKPEPLFMRINKDV